MPRFRPDEKTSVIVDILYFDGCPNHEPARALVEEVLAESGVASQIRELKIIDLVDALQKRFLGSPSVRIDGVDVDPSANGIDRFGMTCRVYRHGNALSGVPPRDMIAAAVRNAMSEKNKSADKVGGIAVTVGSAAAGAGAAATATLASVCCSGPVVAPIVVGLLGATGAAAAASLKPYTPYLFAASFVALVFGFWSAYRTRQSCAVGAPRSVSISVNVSFGVLWTAAALWVTSLIFTLYSLMTAP